MKIPIAYLDWNVLNKIEKLSALSSTDQEVYGKIEKAILEQRVIVPYSNAHISDLIRGYRKKTDFIAGHLAILKKLTRDLCVVQYWGEGKVKWHFRDVNNFFKEALEEQDSESANFYELFTGLGEEVAELMHKRNCDALKTQTLDPRFRKIYNEDPIFSTIFPRSKQEMSVYALHEDLFALRKRFMTDFVLYRNFTKYLNRAKATYPQFNVIAGKGSLLSTSNNPRFLTWDGLWDDVSTNYKPLSNPSYDQLFDIFVKTDLGGYKQDDRFANLIDDALHTFYGAHCAFFVTVDDRCLTKSKLVYEKLAYQVKAFNPADFVEHLKL